MVKSMRSSVIDIVEDKEEYQEGEIMRRNSRLYRKGKFLSLSTWWWKFVLCGWTTVRKGKVNMVCADVARAMSPDAMPRTSSIPPELPS